MKSWTCMLCASCHLDPNTGKLTGRLMNDILQFEAIYSKNIINNTVAGIENGRMVRLPVFYTPA